MVIVIKDMITMKVDKIDTYPKGLKDSISVMNMETTKASVMNIFLEWQSDSTLWEQNAKSRKSTANKTPPINVAIDAKYSRATIIL